MYCSVLGDLYLLGNLSSVQETLPILLYGVVGASVMAPSDGLFSPSPSSFLFFLLPPFPFPFLYFLLPSSFPPSPPQQVQPDIANQVAMLDLALHLG